MGIVSLDRQSSGMVLCANPWSLVWFKSYEYLQCCTTSASLSWFVSVSPSLFSFSRVVGASPFRPQVWHHKMSFVVCIREESLEFYSVLSLPSLIVLRLGDASQFWT